MVADMDPFSIGTAKVQLDRSFPVFSPVFSKTVKEVEMEAVFHPRLNTVFLEFNYGITNGLTKKGLSTYKQAWDEPARKMFADALALYKKDFDHKKLVDNYKKTRAVYGKTKVRFEWKLIDYTKNRVSYPVLEIGYQFKGTSPFFATFMRAAKEEIKDGDDTDAVSSQAAYMYFTRAQADAMAALFDQTRLVELVKSNTVTGDVYYNADIAAPATEADTYVEFGEN